MLHRFVIRMSNIVKIGRKVLSLSVRDGTYATENFFRPKNKTLQFERPFPDRNIFHPESELGINVLSINFDFQKLQAWTETIERFGNESKYRTHWSEDSEDMNLKFPIVEADIDCDDVVVVRSSHDI